MRAHMRRVADEVWVIDLAGEGHGARRDENIFAIQTPVAITLCVRKGAPDPEVPARVWYTRITGSRVEKLTTLDHVRRLSDLAWQPAWDGWREYFTAKPADTWTALPSIFDLVPWRTPGVQVRRTWPINPSPAVLLERWRTLANAPLEERSKLFKTDVHRDISSTPGPLPGRQRPTPPALRDISANTPCPPLERYGFRSFDRQWLIADARIITTPTPDLWTAYGPAQIFLTTQTRFALGNGPALTATAYIPDYHYFAGRGAGVFPLWRDPQAMEPNVAPGVSTQ